MGKRGKWRSKVRKTVLSYNSYNRSKNTVKSAQKLLNPDAPDSEASSDAARSEAAANQDPNAQRQRQGGSAQIDYYGTEEAPT